MAKSASCVENHQETFSRSSFDATLFLTFRQRSPVFRDKPRRLPPLQGIPIATGRTGHGWQHEESSCSYPDPFGGRAQCRSSLEYLGSLLSV